MVDPLISAALNPQRSVVIEACAGSGKTWLLVSRIVRLLLSGVAPSEILAITFTRKAAQEMATRLHEWLHFLAIAPEQEALQFMRDREIAESELNQLLPRARGLFEAVLTAQPPITITTFHGWFLQLLQKAPLSYSGAASATLLEQTSSLVEEAWQRFAESLQGSPEHPAASALHTLFAEYGLDSTRKLMLNFLSKRAEWWAFVRGQKDPYQFALDKLREDLAVDMDVDPIAQLFNQPGFTADLEQFAKFLQLNIKEDCNLGFALQNAVQSTWVEYYEAAIAACFTGSGTIRIQGRQPGNAARAKRLGNESDERFLQLHNDLSAKLMVTRDALAEQENYRFNKNALLCATALLEHFQALKQERMCLDFTDIEWRALELLEHSEHAEYMQYKLDARYRHILLDEFQDTNPLQWQSLKAWLDASASADLRPQVFMVGDPKQSIYRFRRAEARLFEIAADYLIAEYGAERLQQNVSRRNAPAVLHVVNALFTSEPLFTGFVEHEAFAQSLPGRLEVLPLVEKISSDVIASVALRNPLEQALDEDRDLRRQQEANIFAATLAAMIGKTMIHDNGQSRPARYGDIMVLVRSRTYLADYERALRDAGIPYTGSRRGGLLETLEARDLTALLEFLITPFADLQLAQALRSPIFACSNDDLIAIVRSEGSNWWQRLTQLCDNGNASPALQRARTLLTQWMVWTDTLPVHDLLDRIYFNGDVMSRYLSAVPPIMRSGVEANLRAFIEIALTLDAGRYPSLPRFLTELLRLRQAAAEESPDEGSIGDQGDRIRIETIHGAKGLEAPIVWLLDSAAERIHDSYDVLIDWPPHSAKPLHFSLYSRKALRGRQRTQFFDAEAAYTLRENLNLLYVAMTRAKQMLFVSGCEGARASDTSWHYKLSAAVQMCSNNVGDADTTLSYGNEIEMAERTHSISGTSSENAIISSPALMKPLAIGKRDTLKTTAQRRGILLHSLLEQLGEEPNHEVLQRQSGLDDEDFASLYAEAEKIFQSPGLQRFFDPAGFKRSWNELAYVNARGELHRIDRLVEFDDSFWVLDYKTGFNETDPNTRNAYVQQLDEYRQAVIALFPGKPVYSALILGDGTLHEVLHQH